MPEARLRTAAIQMEEDLCPSRGQQGWWEALADLKLCHTFAQAGAPPEQEHPVEQESVAASRSSHRAELQSNNPHALHSSSLWPPSCLPQRRWVSTVLS